MLKLLSLFLLIATTSCYGKKSILHALYMADKPSYEIDDELSMIGEFGFLVNAGNTSASTVTAKINTSQELRKWSYHLTGNALYKQVETEVNGLKNKSASAQRLFISSQVDLKLTEPDNRLFVYLEYDNNRFNGFEYQAALAAGWTSRLWHDKKSEFKYSVGPGYTIAEVEQNSADDDQKSMIVRAAMEYKHQFSDYATFRQFISSEVDEDFTKTKSETSLSTKLSGALAMKLSFDVNHDTGVSQGIEELNTETKVTLVYQFF